MHNRKAHRRTLGRPRRERSRSDLKELAIREIWYDYTYRSRHNGIELTLTYEQFKVLIFKNCEYCKEPPSNIKKKARWGNYNLRYTGIDRKNPSCGYTEENSVPCCQKCNRIKTDILTHEEMRIAMRALLRARCRK